MHTNYKMSSLEFSQISDLEIVLSQHDETKTLCSVLKLASTIHIIFVFS